MPHAAALPGSQRRRCWAPNHRRRLHCHHRRRPRSCRRPYHRTAAAAAVPHARKTSCCRLRARTQGRPGMVGSRRRRRAPSRRCRCRRPPRQAVQATRRTGKKTSLTALEPTHACAGADTQSSSEHLAATRAITWRLREQAWIGRHDKRMCLCEGGGGGDTTYTRAVCTCSTPVREREIGTGAGAGAGAGTGTGSA